MNHSIVASSLIIGSIITISNASYVLMPYNCVNGLPKDAIYTEFTIYLVLASIGVVLGLYAMMYPDHFANMKYLLPILTYVWLIVTFICTSRLFTAFDTSSGSVILKTQLVGSTLGVALGDILYDQTKSPEQINTAVSNYLSGIQNLTFNKTGFIVQYVITSLLVVLTTLFTFVL